MADNPVEIYSDIANSPIDRGDWISIRDEAQGFKYTFEVLGILKPDGDVRNFKLRIMQSTNPNLPVNEVVSKFPIDRNRVCVGSISKARDRDKTYTPPELDKIAALQLRQFLDSLDTKNYRATFRAAIQYLKELNILETNMLEADAKIRLRRICKDHSDLLWSRGGYVGSTGASYRQAASVLEGQISGPRYIEIDFPKLMSGIRLVLESVSILKLRHYD